MMADPYDILREAFVTDEKARQSLRRHDKKVREIVGGAGVLTQGKDQVTISRTAGSTSSGLSPMDRAAQLEEAIARLADFWERRASQASDLSEKSTLTSCASQLRNTVA